MSISAWGVRVSLAHQRGCRDDFLNERELQLLGQAECRGSGQAESDRMISEPLGHAVEEFPENGPDRGVVPPVGGVDHVSRGPRIEQCKFGGRRSQIDTADEPIGPVARFFGMRVHRFLGFSHCERIGASASERIEPREVAGTRRSGYRVSGGR